MKYFKILLIELFNIFFLYFDIILFFYSKPDNY